MKTPGTQKVHAKRIESYERMGIGWWEYNFETSRVDISPEIQSLLEIERSNSSFSPGSFLEFIHADDQSLVQNFLSDLKSASTVIEHRVIKKNGEEVNLAHFVQVDWSDGKPSHIYGITKQIQRPGTCQVKCVPGGGAADAAALRYQELIENFGSGFLSIDNDSVITEINTQAENDLGVDRNNLLGRKLWDCFPEAMFLPFMQHYETVVTERKAVHFEEFYPPYGPWIEVSVYPSESGLSVFFRNINERKEKEEELRVSNERFEFVSKAINHAIWDYDILEQKCLVNDIYKKLFGYSGSFGRVEDWIRHVYPEDRRILAEKISAAISDPDCFTWEGEYRYLRSDGTIAFVYTKAIIIRNDLRQAIRMVGTLADISVQKEVEIKLERNEKKFRAIAISGRDMILILDAKLNIEYISPNFSALTGYDLGQLRSVPPHRYIHPEDFPLFRGEVSTILTESVILLSPFRFKMSNGEYRWIETTLTNHLADPAICSLISNSRDITEKKNSELELRKLSLVAEETRNMVAITDQCDKLIWVNNAFKESTGYSWDKLKDLQLTDALAGPDTDHNLVCIWKKAVSDQQLFSGEMLAYSQSGDRFWIEIKSQPVFDEGGHVRQFISIITDISTRKTAEHQIRLSEEKYRVLFSEDPSPKWSINATTLELTEVNKAALNLYGYSKSEFLGLKLSDLEIPEESGRLPIISDRWKADTGFYFRKVVKHKKKSGEPFFMEIHSHEINLETGIHLIVAGHDITEKIRLQNQLIQEKINVQKEIGKAILNTQEKERSEIGKELHDNVNQLITTAKLYVENIGYYPEERENFVEKSVSLLQRSINEIRVLTKALVPPSFYDIGLEASLAELLDHYRELKIFKVDLKLSIFPKTLERELELTIYRIIQEQLTNTTKYAEAKNVLISIFQGTTDLTVTYKDNGAGFDFIKKRNGLGLSNIKNRVEVFKGVVELITSAGAGYEMKVIFPIDQSSQFNNLENALIHPEQHEYYETDQTFNN